MMSNLEEVDEDVLSGKVPKVVQVSKITKLTGVLYKDQVLYIQAHWFIFSTSSPPFS